MEELKRLELISVAGSNIQCFKDKQCTIPDDSEVEYIDNFIELDAWMFSGKRKAFLYDEAIKSSPSKKAMSKLNTKWLEVIPELSKGRMQLIVITQELQYTEKTFLHPTFVRGIWHKIELPKRHPQYRKMVRLYSVLLPEVYIFKNIPAAKIIFDPYRSATFKLLPDTAKFENLSLELQVAYDYAKGMSTDDIVEKYKPEIRDRTQATRELRKGIKVLVEKLQVASLKRRNIEAENLQQSQDD